MNTSARSAIRARARDISSSRRTSLRRNQSLPTASVVEPEVHDVAVSDEIFLAFQAQFSGVAGAGLTAECDVVRVSNGFGANETLFEIGVDHAGRRRRP